MMSRNLNSLCIIFTLAIFIQSSAFADENKDIFVDPIKGSVKGTPGLDGAIDTPFKTVKDAINYAEKEFNRGETRFPYTIQLREGVYDEVLTRSEKGVKKDNIRCPFSLSVQHSKG
jgi:hypothetical protein